MVLSGAVVVSLRGGGGDSSVEIDEEALSRAGVDAAAPGKVGVIQNMGY